jgi:hypothetical protein
MVTNLLVLPGLGSVVAGRRGVGFFQMGLAMGGLMVSLVFLWVVARGWLLTREWVLPGLGLVMLGLAGVGSFVAGWCWALVTSLRLLHEARGEEEGARVGRELPKPLD